MSKVGNYGLIILTSLRHDVFRFLKSIHILIDPFFFLTTTKLEHQDECLVGAMIPSANIF